MILCSLVETYQCFWESTASTFTVHFCPEEEDIPPKDQKISTRLHHVTKKVFLTVIAARISNFTWYSRRIVNVKLQNMLILKIHVSGWAGPNRLKDCSAFMFKTLGTDHPRTKAQPRRPVSSATLLWEIHLNKSLIFLLSLLGLKWDEYVLSAHPTEYTKMNTI